MAKPTFVSADLAYKGKDGKFYKVEGLTKEIKDKIDNLGTSSQDYETRIQALETKDQQLEAKDTLLEAKDKELEQKYTEVKAQADQTKEDLATFRKGIEVRIADVDYTQTQNQTDMPIGIRWKVPQTKDGTFIQINVDTGKPNSGNWSELYQYTIVYKKDGGSAVQTLGIEKVLPVADDVFKTKFVEEMPEENLFEENTCYVVKTQVVVP